MTVNERTSTTAAAGSNAALSAAHAAGSAFGQSAATTHSGLTGPVLAVISHPVMDYAAWRPTYDGAEPVREKAGVTGAEVFHDPDDANRIVIIHRFNTVAAAQDFLADPDLKSAMTKSGVSAPPTVILATRYSGSNRVGTGQVLAVISHPVQDFDSWRAAYAAAEPIRRKAGVSGAEVFQDSRNANNVVIIHRFETVSDARDFLANPDLKTAMARGGVLAPPTGIIAVRN
jgi:quinol monooxygenase YgiN